MANQRMTDERITAIRNQSEAERKGLLDQRDERIAELESIVSLAEKLIQPGENGAELVGNSKFTNALMMAVRNYKKANA